MCVCVLNLLCVFCCLVALNFQTPGEQMDLNQGRFLPNGRCGYVLKPAFLCSPTSDFDPENTGGGPGHTPTQLTIRVSRFLFNHQSSAYSKFLKNRVPHLFFVFFNTKLMLCEPRLNECVNYPNKMYTNTLLTHFYSIFPEQN